MIGGPAHGARVDVVQLAARAWAPDLVTLSVHEELTLAITHCGKNGAVISHGDKRQPSQNGGGGDDVGDQIRLRLIQRFVPLSPASLHQGGLFLWTKMFTQSAVYVCLADKRFEHYSSLVCALFAQSYSSMHSYLPPCTAKL
jgi:hypothetical protein